MRVNWFQILLAVVQGCAAGQYLINQQWIIGAIAALWTIGDVLLAFVQ